MHEWPIVVPEILYKYRSWTDKYHKRLLTHNEIYFAEPSSFNDPFDCQIAPSLEIMANGDKRAVLLERSRIDSLNWPNEKRIEWTEAWMRILEDPAKRNEMKKKWRRETNQEVGVFSLSANRTNIVMWAHYADSNKGLCIGLSTRHLEDFCLRLAKERGRRGGLRKVDYVADYPVIDLFSPNHMRGDGTITAVTNKSVDWCYEEEYRLIITRPANDRTCKLQNSDRVYVLDDEAIVSVIMGCRMAPEYREEVKAVLRKKGAKIDLFKASVKETSFGLDFEKVTY